MTTHPIRLVTGELEGADVPGAAKLCWIGHTHLKGAGRLVRARIEQLRKCGFRIIDAQVHANPTADPPVIGWIAYREEAPDERKPEGHEQHPLHLRTPV